MTQFENDRDELHKITSNEEKNVIDDTIINAIKEKVAAHNNNSSLVLADQRYNQSVVPMAQGHPEFMENNKSFMKVKNRAEEKIKAMQAEEALLMQKLDQANQQREYLAMEQEDKRSYKYQMECLSQIFRDRFVRPKFPEVREKDHPIQIIFAKLPPSKVNRTPQVISD